MIIRLAVAFASQESAADAAAETTRTKRISSRFHRFNIIVLLLLSL
jgi:hypothetical protein